MRFYAKSLRAIGAVGLFVLFGLLAARPAAATSITILVGDKDGFGAGLPDDGIVAAGKWPGPSTFGTQYDGRSAAEAAALDGAQVTDVYSAIDPDNGPNNFSSVDILFPFAGFIDSAVLTIAAGDFQANNPYDPLLATINGFSIPFLFSDGFLVNATHTITLDAAEIAAANLAGQVVLHLDHTGPLNNRDYVAFDFFQLDANAPVPEPASLILLGTGLIGVASRARRRSKKK